MKELFQISLQDNDRQAIELADDALESARPEWAAGTRFVMNPTEAVIRTGEG